MRKRLFSMNEKQLRQKILDMHDEIHALEVRMGYQSRSAKREARNRIAQIEAGIAHLEKKLEKGEYIGGSADMRLRIRQREKNDDDLNH